MRLDLALTVVVSLSAAGRHDESSLGVCSPSSPGRRQLSLRSGHEATNDTWLPGGRRRQIQSRLRQESWAAWRCTDTKAWVRCRCLLSLSFCPKFKGKKIEPLEDALRWLSAFGLSLPTFALVCPNFKPAEKRSSLVDHWFDICQWSVINSFQKHVLYCACQITFVADTKFKLFHAGISWIVFWRYVYSRFRRSVPDKALYPTRQQTHLFALSCKRVLLEARNVSTLHKRRLFSF